MIQKVVPFYGDQLVAMKDERGEWAALRPMCEALGLDESSQRKKLRAAAWASTAVLNTSVAEDGRSREMFHLSLRCVPMWLATISPSRVKAEVRDKLALYQRECAEVLARAFLDRAAPAVSGEMDDLRRRIAEMEARQWHFVNASIGMLDRRVTELERGARRLRGGMRHGVYGRQGGSKKLPKPKAQGSLLPVPSIAPKIP